MSVSNIHIGTVHVPNPQAPRDKSGFEGPEEVPAVPSGDFSYSTSNDANVLKFGYRDTISNGVQTLSSSGAERSLAIAGLLYFPNAGEPAHCRDAAQNTIPANATGSLLAHDAQWQYVALAPIISANCTSYYLTEAQKQYIGAFIFYFPDNQTTVPENITTSDYGFNSNDLWQPSQFPVYAVPGLVGQVWMDQLAKYIGNITAILNGPNATTIPQLLRLEAEIFVGNTDVLPSLWDFLLIAVAVLACILGFMSITMHCIQQYRRRSLRRRVMNGELDLESLGIKQLTVPKELLQEMPTYVFEENKVAGLRADVRPLQEVVGKAAELDDIDTAGGTSSTPYAQLTCAICIDDFKANETRVREMPCRHIFHPECIDEFLLRSSSLCPLCKKSALPKGYCPRVITNTMVRRDRLLRFHLAQQGAEASRTANGEFELSPVAPVAQGGRATRFVRRALAQLQPLPTSTRDSFELPMAPVTTTNTNSQAGTTPATGTTQDNSADVLPARLRSSTTEPQRSRTQRRRERGQQRALELLGEAQPGEAVAAADSAERSTLWRRTIRRVFPGFS